MKDITLILLAAGTSSRFGLATNKAWLRIGDEPLWHFVAKRFAKFYNFKKIIIAVGAQDLKYCQKICDDDFEFVCGAEIRQKSLANALENVKSEYVMVSDVARAGVSENLILSLIENIDDSDCISPFLGVSDTSYLGENQIPRDELKLIQTPQLSRTALLKKALQSDEIFTDDSAAIKSVGGRLKFIQGEANAHKLTFANDLWRAKLPKPSKDVFCGNGYDVHALRAGESIVLCGVQIPCEWEFIAHSDGDVAIHALIDAICGASRLGDIGELFPDTDPQFKGIKSTELLKNVVARVQKYGYEVINADITIIAQRPKLATFKQEMEKNIARILGTKNVNVKATTNEKLGFVGRSEGIAVIANANLKFYD